jgi:hypothetical protein
MGMALLAGCERSDPLAPIDNGAPLTKAGGNTAGANNLSVPVFFAEGIGLTGLNVAESTGMPGDTGDVWGETFPYLDVSYYLQQSGSIWQADWVSGAVTPPVEVVSDWADALTHQIWDEHSIIRTEVVLFKTDFAAYQAALATPLTGYAMSYLYGDGLEEVWGTPADPTNPTIGTIIPADAATAYSSCARFRIEKLVWPADITNVPTGIIPDTFAPGYDAYIASTFYNSSVYDRYGVDGITGAYSAELNVPGKVIYGYNWDLAHFRPPTPPKKDTTGFSWVTGVTKVGWWRLTFNLDPSWDITTRNAAIRALDLGDLDDTCDFHPVVVVPSDDPTAAYTYLDLFVNN